MSLFGGQLLQHARWIKQDVNLPSHGAEPPPPLNGVIALEQSLSFILLENDSGFIALEAGSMK